jgi:hypothetical protein
VIQNSENQINGQEEVFAEGYQNIHLVEEYLDEQKPNYEWDSKDNLIVCLKFPKEKEFPSWVFEKFVVEHCIFSRETNILTKQSQEEIKNWELSKIEEEEPTELDFKNLMISAIEDITEDANTAPIIDFYELEPIPKYKKTIWNKGIIINYPVQEKHKTVVVSSEITCDNDANIILVKVEKKHNKSHKEALTAILNALSATTLDFQHFAVCNCPLCQEVEKRNPGNGYQIPYDSLKNLHDKFVPKVQCYSSGKNRLLDEISLLERPEIKVAIIHELNRDTEFIEKVNALFFQRELRSDVWNRSLPLGGAEFEKEFQIKVAEAEIILVLVSPYLLGDEKACEQISTTIRRVNKKTAILLAIVVRDISAWEDCQPFNQLDSRIQILSESPISSSKKPDEAWKKIGDKLHREIEEWLNKFHRFKVTG